MAGRAEEPGRMKTVKKKLTILWAACVFLFLVSVRPAYAYNFFTGYPFYQARPDTENPRILMVGNSLTYTNNIPQLLENMCKNTGIRASVDSVTRGGHSLSQYAFPSQDYEKQLSDAIITKLTTQRWDYVILQGRSDETIVNEETLRKAIACLYPYIKNSGAQMVLYLTWAPDWNGTGYDIDKRQAEIAEVYYSIARQYQCALAPSGIAFARERKLYPNMDLYYSSTDRLHPNLSGSYLSACCIYGTLFGKSPENITYSAGLASDRAGQLRALAADVTVRRSSENTQTLTVSSMTRGYQMKPGSKKKLEISSSAGVRMIRCSSSNAKVAVVSSQGTVTAKSAGTARITVLMSNNQTIAWDIVVSKLSTVTLGAGDTQKLDFAYGGFRWSSSNKKAAAIKNGVITAKSKGTAVLTGKNNSGFTVSVKVTVKSAPEKVTVKNAPRTLEVGKTLQLQLNISKVRVSYQSSNSGILSVSSSGKLLAKRPGTVRITVKTYNGKSTSFKVTANVLTKKITITNVKSGATMKRGQSLKLKLNFTPQNVTNRSVSFKSSNSRILKVSKSGTVKALRTGKAKITVTAGDGSKKRATVEIKVKK